KAELDRLRTQYDVPADTRPVERKKKQPKPKKKKAA
ncbi:MAG: hypothetical protein ACI9NC_001559, partial [Verrucomicrobiales bacterium]